MRIIFFSFTVYYRPCSACDEVTIFEGSSVGLLNMGTYLVCHSVLRNYMHSFLHGRFVLKKEVSCIRIIIEKRTTLN